MERTDFEQWKSKEVARLLALVEAERRYYQEMVAALPIGVAVLSADRAILLANRSFRQTFGMRSEEIRRKTIDQILPSDELVEKIRSVHIEPDHAGRGSMTLEAAGKLYRVDVRPIRSWDEDMELETLVAIQEIPGAASPDTTLTVTRPAATPAATTVSTADLPAIVWQADVETLQFTAVSGRASSILGIPPEDWVRAAGFFEGRIFPEDREATMALYRWVLEHGGEASAEFRIMTPAGEPQWCRETVIAHLPAKHRDDSTAY